MREKPVENTPDRRCLFQSDETADVNIRLLYTLKSNGGAALLTGEFGCGMAIDEGQLVEDPEVLEQIRLLLNFQLNDAFLITLLLVGKEALVDKVRNSPPLDQRIAPRGILKSMVREDVHEYVAPRLAVAGRKEPVFSSDALDLVHDFSDGVAHTVNNICDIALVIGYGRKLDSVDAGWMRRLIQAAEGSRV